MASSDSDASTPSPSPAGSVASSSSFDENWKQRMLIPTLLAGLVGGGVGLVSKHRKTHGLANLSATYASNFAIVTACYCGAREWVTVARKTGPDDLVSSAVAGFGTGALLGRLQGGQRGAVRYSVIFAVVGTTVDYATLTLKPVFNSFKESIYGEWSKGEMFKIPEWSPIQVLDEEALATKEAREKQLYAQRTLGKLSKEEP